MVVTANYTWAGGRKAAGFINRWPTWKERGRHNYGDLPTPTKEEAPTP